MLKNAYLLAKTGADTAEKEQHFAGNFPIGRRVARRCTTGPQRAVRRFCSVKQGREDVGTLSEQNVCGKSLEIGREILAWGGGAAERTPHESTWENQPRVLYDSEFARIPQNAQISPDSGDHRKTRRGAPRRRLVALRRPGRRARQAWRKTRLGKLLSNVWPGLICNFSSNLG